MAKLLCEGACTGYTHHAYDMDRKIVNAAGVTTAIEKVYRCDVCGTQRRYGLEAPEWTYRNATEAASSL